MANSVSQSILSRVLVISLVDCAAHDEQVVSADTNQEERHELVDSTCFTTNDVHEAKSGSVRQSNAEQAHDSEPATTEHRAERSQEEEQVDDDKENGGKDQGQIVVCILAESSVVAVSSRDVNIGGCNGQDPFVEKLVDLLLNGKISFLFNVWVPIVLHPVDVLDSLGLLDVVCTDAIAWVASVGWITFKFLLSEVSW